MSIKHDTQLAKLAESRLHLPVLSYACNWGFLFYLLFISYYTVPVSDLVTCTILAITELLVFQYAVKAQNMFWRVSKMHFQYCISSFGSHLDLVLVLQWGVKNVPCCYFKLCLGHCAIGWIACSHAERCTKCPMFLAIR